ncbi:MAG: ATP-binding protein, partial [Sphaerochaetaceae bacterium]|nr:ATP-binding protein [Sphaerochaetaceae bacterium]
MKVIDPTISSFESLIAGNRLYVDKTAYIYKLVTGPRMVLFSRPRRFGKSLTVSTLDALFRGKRELFAGLAIDSLPYDWKVYPVIHIDFGTCGASDASSLERWMNERLMKIGASYGFHENGDSPYYTRFEDTIDALAEKTQVVILIDEYDKVLSDNIFNPEVEKMRTVLSNFYQVIKSKNEEIRFAFITGVTKYAKLSVFSKMNNLSDISMDSDYALMCGYSQEELEGSFKEYIELGIKKAGMDREDYLATLKRKYDGYRFAPDAETVYNPVSVGLFFSKGGRLFNDYWIDTGSMTLLMNIAKKVDFNLATDLDDPLAASDLGTFDILNLATNPTGSSLKSLLLQTGYLTIGRSEQYGQLLYLVFPNMEVQKGFCNGILSAYYTDGPRFTASGLLASGAFMEGDTCKAIGILKSIYSSIPSIIQTQDEGYYQSILYAMLLAMGADVRAEVSNAGGRIDAVLLYPRTVYVIEFKKDQDAQAGLDQIKARGYADQYTSNPQGRTIHLLGISFDSGLRNISDWKEEII